MKSAAARFALTTFLFLLGGAIVARAQNAVSPLRVEEDKMRFHLFPHSRLDFPIFNTSAKPISGKFSLELLNYEKRSRSCFQVRDFHRAAGRHGRARMLCRALKIAARYFRYPHICPKIKARTGIYAVKKGRP